MDRLNGIRRELDALRADGKGRVLAGIAIGWGLLLGTRMIYPVLLPSLRAEFGFSLTTAGLLITVIWLAYALGQTPAGVLVDRHGERILLPLSVACVVVAVGLVLLAPSAILLFGATALIGAGMSVYTIARITALSDLQPDRLGSALGLTMATGDIGQTVLPPIAGAIVAALAWRAGLGFVLPFLAATAVFLWFTLPGSEAAAEDGADDGDVGIRYVLGTLRQPATLLMTGILFLYILVWQTFTAFYPTYLIEFKGLSPTAASGVFGLFFAVGIVVKPASGLAYDRLGIRTSLPLVLAGAVVGFLILPILEGMVAIVAVTLLIGTMLGSGAITQPYLADVLPAEIQGTGLGMIRSAASTLGSVGPVLFGAAADAGHFDAGYVVLGVIVLAAVVVTRRLPAA